MGSKNQVASGARPARDGRMVSLKNWRSTMATYVSLVRFTQQGGQAVKELPRRVEANTDNMRKRGIEVRSWFMTTGQYDAVIVFDAPTDEAVVTAALAICQQGTAHTETMRAFSLDEAKKLIANLP
jgi:uncharacterized protein with GYD domain